MTASLLANCLFVCGSTTRLTGARVALVRDWDQLVPSSQHFHTVDVVSIPIPSPKPTIEACASATSGLARPGIRSLGEAVKIGSAKSERRIDSEAGRWLSGGRSWVRQRCCSFSSVLRAARR